MVAKVSPNLKYLVLKLRVWIFSTNQLLSFRYYSWTHLWQENQVLSPCHGSRINRYLFISNGQTKLRRACSVGLPIHPCSQYSLHRHQQAHRRDDPRDVLETPLDWPKTQVWQGKFFWWYILTLCCIGEGSCGKNYWWRGNSGEDLGAGHLRLQWAQFWVQGNIHQHLQWRGGQLV